MKKYILAALILGFSSLVTAALGAPTTMTPTPLGFWNTVDDKTGQTLSVVQIYPEKDGSLSGKIVKIYPVLGQKTTDLCTECDGNLKNQPILSMKIMSGMTINEPGSTAWDNGQVLDPKSGNLYSGKMTVSNDNNTLTLRGYVLVPLLGRSETWERTIDPKTPQVVKTN
jgi:uncharacterized protein (DUF2147 family)